jgi:4-hydroxybenzoate polyprenyltransferase
MLNQKIHAILALTRWKEHTINTLILTLLGVFIANGHLGIRIVLVYFANWLAMAFPYIINDVEDADDDALDPKKVLRNPISNKSLTKGEGYLVALFTSSLALCLYVLIAVTLDSYWTLGIGVVIIFFAFVYSWKKIRLKSWPILDLVSHGFMLSAGHFLAAYFAFSESIRFEMLLLAAVTYLISIRGDLENENRDFEIDKLTKIQNTVQLIGNIKISRILQAIVAYSSIISVIVAVVVLAGKDLVRFLLAYISCFTISVLFYWLTKLFTKQKMHKQYLLEFAAQSGVIILLIILLVLSKR